MTKIYILELENGKYYVGKSNHINNRIIAHFNTNGSEWTKLHKPIRVISQIQGDSFDEEKYTLITMNKYGVDNVRGGSYCRIILSRYEKEKAVQTINSIMDRCYKCGKAGHFARECSFKRKIIKDEHLTLNIRIDEATQQGSIIDVITRINPGIPSRAAGQIFTRLSKSIPELTEKYVKLRMNGKGRLTPVADSKTLIEIICLLPGKHAREFRHRYINQSIDSLKFKCLL